MEYLDEIANDVYVNAAPQSFLGLRIGTRMTIVRRSDGSLFVHSPTPLAPALRKEVDALGRVAQIVAPNLGHHLYAGDWKAAYPEAKLHGARGLSRRRKDLRLDATLGSEDDRDFASDFEIRALDGNLLEESVFFHRESGTVVSADLIENFVDPHSHLPTQIYLKVNGIAGRPGIAHWLKPLFRDKRAGRRAIDDILEWDFDRITLTHGEIIGVDAKDQLRDTYRWLR